MTILSQSWLRRYWREVPPTSTDADLARQVRWDVRRRVRRPGRPLWTLPRAFGLGVFLGFAALLWGGWPRPETWLRLGAALLLLLGSWLIVVALVRGDFVQAGPVEYSPRPRRKREGP